ncbi:unnamed protein product [Bemisia tabaci]|uniref:Alpha-1,3/1,6-mannosyltransferase ALG2 n=1 Tax=Bemisia tabaci TaxID=7038 RepID=A0A9P0AB96_BEMTA|nr:PREDICTED: alpha-1,3/1,6-mannosyltransferase ALG2 [Bemisia tabaci]CAH0388860.1 unnamed protein product [Bemisia tabaci]
MSSKRIVILHPDLGIGGAERLVVDAALALKKRNHEVCFVTTHHDRSHCFKETVDGTFEVIVVGDWLPRNIFGYFFALCAYLRMIYAAFYIVFFSNLAPLLVFCDLVSVCIPVLKLGHIPVIFYCHHPDLLLSQAGGRLKALYRFPLNWLEEKTTAKASIILVNSKYTQKVFKETFKTIKSTPDILYPSIPIENFSETISCLPLKQILKNPDFPSDATVFLSINRYERKKSIDLAIKALKQLKESLPESTMKKVYLIVAGGYDTRLLENVEHYDELSALCETSNVKEHVCFLRSISNEEKVSLMKHCVSIVYTPPNEHYGIVPIEAMFLNKPVIAQNSGGPTETVVDGETGFLCDNNSNSFAEAMKKFINDPNLSQSMGLKGRKRFDELYSADSFSQKLESYVQCVVDDKSN